MKDIKRISAGVVFESDVLHFIDQLASSQQRTRSFIINQVIRFYARVEHQKPNLPETSPAVPQQGADAIRF